MSRLPALALVAAAATLSLTACADDPRLLKANQAGITVALGPDADAMAQAVEVANQHCVNVRRIAVLDRVTEVGDRTLAFFDCVQVS